MSVQVGKGFIRCARSLGCHCLACKITLLMSMFPVAKAGRFRTIQSTDREESAAEMESMKASHTIAIRHSQDR